MSSETRQVQESPLVQGVDEKLTYTLTVTPWGNTPSGPVVKAFDITDGGYLDVSNTVLVGSPTILENVITLPSLENLTAGHKYRVEVQWLSGGNTFEAYAEVEAEL
jgi:hypothetical protein